MGKVVGKVLKSWVKSWVIKCAKNAYFHENIIFIFNIFGL